MRKNSTVVINQNATNDADCSPVEKCDRTAKQNIALATASVVSLDQSPQEAERGATKQTRAAQYAYWPGTLLGRKSAKARASRLLFLSRARASVRLETLPNDILLPAGDGCACLSRCVLTVPHVPLEKANARHALQPRQTKHNATSRGSTSIGISHFPAQNTEKTGTKKDRRARRRRGLIKC